MTEGTNDIPEDALDPALAAEVVLELRLCAVLLDRSLALIQGRVDEEFFRDQRYIVGEGMGAFYEVVPRSDLLSAAEGDALDELHAQLAREDVRASIDAIERSKARANRLLDRLGNESDEFLDAIRDGLRGGMSAAQKLSERLEKHRAGG